MKKHIIILVFAMAGFLFAGVQSANAQVDYSFWVEWIDDDCSGGTILEKELRWEVKHIASQTIIGSGTVDVTSTSNPYEVESNGNIIYDCPNCYKVTAKVRYRDALGWFCSGEDYEICSGDELIDGDLVYVIVEMN